MNKYIFKTTATMKPYNSKKWWIDGGIIREITINADNVNEALKQYQKIVKDKYYVDISNNALKNKAPMYIDGKNGEAVQVGYVITAKTYFYNDTGATGADGSTQYIDLWVEVLQYDYPDFN